MRNCSWAAVGPQWRVWNCTSVRVAYLRRPVFLSGGPRTIAAMTSLLAASHVDSAEAVFWIGVLIVAGCLIAAAVVAFRTRDWLVPLILCGIALVAGIILLD